MQNTVPQEKGIFNLNPNVLFLGIVSLLTDTSSEMIFTLVPLFLSNVLNTSFIAIGLIGGLSESTDAIFRIFSGWLSDRTGKRKPLAVLGYTFSTVAKPFMYLASNWGIVLGVRFADRVGKGTRSSSRDALIADSVTSEERGKSFGLHRAMDTLGAVLGLALAALIIYLVQGGGIELSLKTYQWLVLIGTIPAVLAVILLVALVKERKKPAYIETSHEIKSPHSNRFDTRFKLFLAIVTLFTLGNSSSFFVILRAQNMNVPLIGVTLMLVLFNVTYAAISLPSGILSDKLGRKRIIALGWFIYALAYLGFAVSTQTWHIWLLFAVYGIYYGITEGVSRAFVADMVPAERRGTAYGLYFGAVGIALLLASLIAGWLWESVSPAAPFYFGAGLALLATLGIMGLVRE